jgi:hypothetical protein
MLLIEAIDIRKGFTMKLPSSLGDHPQLSLPFYRSVSAIAQEKEKLVNQSYGFVYHGLEERRGRVVFPSLDIAYGTV